MRPRPEPVDVCLISRYFDPAPGGAAERFRRYAPGLRKRGVHLRVVTAHCDDLPLRAEIDGIQVRRIPVNGKPHLASTPLLREALDGFRTTNRWPDVLQLFEFPVSSIPYLWIVRLSGVPRLHVGTMVNREKDTYEGRITERLKDRIAFRLMFQPIDCAITSSEIMSQRLIEAGASPRWVEVIPNGVDLQRFRPVRTAGERCKVRQQLGFGPDEQVILFVGGIVRRKGVDTLLAAWPEIVRQRPQARLILVGHRRDHTPEFRAFSDRIDWLVSNSPSSARILFTGFVPNVEEYMRAADVFVFPSRREGMGNVVAEAMASGLPCVLTPFVGLPAEFGKPGREFLLVPHDSAALSAAVLDVLGSSSRREKLGRSARSWVEEHLDVEKSMDRYAMIYRELAAASRKGARWPR